MKKKVISIFLWICVATSLMACNKSEHSSAEENSAVSEKEPEQEENDQQELKMQTLEVVTGVGYDAQWSESEEKYLASMEYPMIELGENSAKKYQKLQEALQTSNKEKKEKQEKQYQDNLSYAHDELENNGQYFETYTANERVFTRRADSKVLSLLYCGDTYSGGAHGYYYCWGETLDTQTGAKLNLSDVVTDLSSLSSCVSEQMNKYWSDLELFTDMDSYFQDTEEENISWTLDYNGITIYFNPYDIAAYASGAQVVTLSYEEYPNLVKEEYKTVPGSYGVELSPGNTFFYDIDMDGKLDQLDIYGTMSDDGYYEGQLIIVNGKEYEDEIYGYGIKPVFIHTAGGDNYLYIQNNMDNDYRAICVYGLREDGAEKACEFNGGFHEIMREMETYYPSECVLTDPEEFVLDVRTDALSTSTGFRTYCVGDDGAPKSDVAWFELQTTHILTVKRDIEVMIVSKDTGKEQGTEILKEGTKVETFRTDNESFVDVKLEDGRIGRFQMTFEYPMTIDGMDVEKIFDGIMYAG